MAFHSKLFALILISNFIISPQSYIPIKVMVMIQEKFSTSIKVSRLRERLTLSAFCLLTFSFVSGRAEGATLLNVSGSVDSGQTLNADEAAAVSFNLNKTFTDVSISADITCVGCTGGLFLMKNQIGPGTPLGDLVIGTTFPNMGNPLLSGLTLDPGDYFLVLSIEQGFAVWPGSLSPTVTTAADVTHGIDFRADDTVAFPPQSDFDVIFGAGALHYSITGNLSPSTSTPEPNSSWAIFTVAGWLGFQVLKRIVS